MDTNFACNVHFAFLLPLGWALLGCFLPCPASPQLSLAAGQGGPEAGAPRRSAVARAGATSLYIGSHEPSLERLFEQVRAFELAPGLSCAPWQAGGGHRTGEAIPSSSPCSGLRASPGKLEPLPALRQRLLPPRSPVMGNAIPVILPPGTGELLSRGGINKGWAR